MRPGQADDRGEDLSPPFAVEPVNKIDSGPSLIAWGGYDSGKPRVRLLLSALRSCGARVIEIAIPVWSGVEDKSSLTRTAVVIRLARLALSYPAALLRLLRSPRFPVLLPYPGIPDIFIVWPFARLRRQALVLDAFLPLHDTICRDRGLVAPAGLAGKVLHLVERTALRLADTILVDTDEHGRFYEETFGIEPHRFQTVLVGAEAQFRDARKGEASTLAEFGADRNQPFVLFYGQLIPLHGVSTILAAIGLTAGQPFKWLIVGSGQEEDLVRTYFEQERPANAAWLPWIDYNQLPAVIRAATIGLGIFGTTEKAGRVIPNKLFQVLHAGKPVITRSSPAVDPLAARYPRSVLTIPAGEGPALAAAVSAVMSGRRALAPLPGEGISALGPEMGAHALLAQLRSFKR